jgi:hypothetical protein
MAKVAKIYDGTAWVDLATSVPDLSNYQLKSEGGLTLVKKQTIGTAVSSVVVNNAFSATYDNYKIIVSGGTGSTGGEFYFQLNGITSTTYYSGLQYSILGSTTALASQSNLTAFNWCGNYSTTTAQANIEVQNPFIALPKLVQSGLIGAANTGPVGSSQGYNATTTPCTGFTLATTGGTVTGGTVYVYGYNKG